MTKLDEILDIKALVREVQDGYVKVRHHQDAQNLAILNYAEKAQYEKHWNDATRACRGLIVDTETNKVLARPFEKFFNYGEHPDGSLPLDAWATVTDKMDGSLGILYPAPDGGWAIATRGSFHSEQAEWATAHLRARYTGGPGDLRWVPEPDLTYLFEIVYPENRIVLDYGETGDLFLIGTRDISGGGYVTSSEYGASWPGPLVEPIEAHTLREALALPPRPNAEGVVVVLHEARYAAPGYEAMIKIKQEDYVRLHKLVTGLNERAVWEHLSTHEGQISGLLEAVPDEFHDWVRDVASTLLDRHETIVGRAHDAYHRCAVQIYHGTGRVSREERKAFAADAREHGDLTPLLFMLLDGRDISAAVWKTLRPVGDTRSLMNRNPEED